MINLYALGTLISAPILISAHPLSIPNTHANRIISAKANTTSDTVPAQ